MHGCDTVKWDIIKGRTKEDFTVFYRRLTTREEGIEDANDHTSLVMYHLLLRLESGHIMVE